MLDHVVGREFYSFTYGFLGYHKAKIIEDEKRDHFYLEWGYFTNNVILFGLKNVPIV